MLQQTRVETAAPYFERFTARLPNIPALAAAPLDDVLHLWSGLGYYARARNLHAAARIVARRHGGALPTDQRTLETLPGIGRTTAAAIVCQAHGRRAAILDGNVKRVLARCHRVAGAPTSSATARALWRLAEAHTPRRRVADYAQAIMDLGATVCLRRQPRCQACPLAQTCEARAAGEAERYPEPAPRRPRRVERRRFLVLADANGFRFVERRPPRGLWGGLWTPPEGDAALATEECLAALGVDPADMRRIAHGAVFRHAFTHFDLDVAPTHVQLRRRPPALADGAWIRPGEHALGLSAVAAKLIKRQDAADEAWERASRPQGSRKSPSSRAELARRARNAPAERANGKRRESS